MCCSAPGDIMSRPNPRFIEEVQEIVKNSPFPRHLSMRLTAMAIDSATVELEISSKHLQPFGIVHGGVLATLIDTATFWSVFMRIPEDAGLVNLDLKLNYLSSVQDGRLRAEGVSIRSGNNISYSEARVFDGREKLLAHGTSTLMTLPDKGLNTRNSKFLPQE